MIVESLEVEKFRGFVRASLVDFTGVNILVGRAGCGKSSILEALYIGLALEDGLKYIIKRRGWFGLASVRALFHNGDSEAKIKVKLQDGSYEKVTIRRRTTNLTENTPILKKREFNMKRLVLLIVEAEGKITRTSQVYIDSKGKCEIVEELKNSKVLDRDKHVADTVLIDWNSVLTYGTPEEVYSNLIEKGGSEAKKLVIELLQEEYRYLYDLAAICVNGEWSLYLIFKDKAIPYYVAGDSVRYTLIHIMSMLTYSRSVILTEEPELHVHPKFMRIIAKAILNSYKDRENQIFITTHSSEFIETLLEEAKELNLRDQDLKIYRLFTTRGELYCEKYTLSDAYEAIKEIGWDFRM